MHIHHFVGLDFFVRPHSILHLLARFPAGAACWQLVEIRPDLLGFLSPVVMSDGGKLVEVFLFLGGRQKRELGREFEYAASTLPLNSTGSRYP